MGLLVLIEWSWTAFNVIGIIAAGMVFHRAFQRRRAVSLLGLDASYLLVANRNLREEGTKFIIHLCGIFIGTYAIGEPNRPQDDISLLAMLFTWLLVVMMFLLALSSILNLVDDYRLGRMVDKQRDENAKRESVVQAREDAVQERESRAEEAPLT